MALYAIGFHFIVKGLAGRTGPMAAAQRSFSVAFFTLAGLYAVNFLSAMAAVLLPIDTLSGEIASGVAQTLARPAPCAAARSCSASGWRTSSWSSAYR